MLAQGAGFTVTWKMLNTVVNVVLNCIDGGSEALQGGVTGGVCLM